MLYNIPAEKTREAIEFVSRFDFAIIAQQVIEAMLVELEQACDAEEKNHSWLLKRRMQDAQKNWR